MKNFLFFLFACCLLAGCASKADKSGASLENPLLIPILADSSVYITSNNVTHAQEDIAGTLLAFLQSECDMRMASSKSEADYAIHLTVESFENLKTDASSVDAAEVLLPAFMGALMGAQLGNDIGDGEGAAWGAGIGVVAGAGIGYASADATSRTYWQMYVSVDIEDKHGETFITRVSAHAQGEDLDAQTAAQALEFEIVMAIVDAFQKNF